MEPGSVLVAPGGRHLHLKADRTTTLGDELPIGGLRPRADLTIADAAQIFGRDLLLVVLTGMGKDGLEGAQEVRRHGGTILAEAESSCTVYGMPRAIVEAGLADGVHELADMPAAIAAVAG
jgi:two-component system chemotaxis response regulator CheB